MPESLWVMKIKNSAPNRVYRYSGQQYVCGKQTVLCGAQGRSDETDFAKCQRTYEYRAGRDRQVKCALFNLSRSDKNPATYDFCGTFFFIECNIQEVRKHFLMRIKEGEGFFERFITKFV